MREKETDLSAATRRRDFNFTAVSAFYSCRAGRNMACQSCPLPSTSLCFGAVVAAENIQEAWLCINKHNECY